MYKRWFASDNCSGTVAQAVEYLDANVCGAGIVSNYKYFCPSQLDIPTTYAMIETYKDDVDCVSTVPGITYYKPDTCAGRFKLIVGENSISKEKTVTMQEYSQDNCGGYGNMGFGERCTTCFSYMSKKRKFIGFGESASCGSTPPGSFAAASTSISLFFLAFGLFLIF